MLIELPSDVEGSLDAILQAAGIDAVRTHPRRVVCRRGIALCVVETATFPRRGPTRAAVCRRSHRAESKALTWDVLLVLRDHVVGTLLALIPLM